jgi:hypothetical protein
MARPEIVVLRGATALALAPVDAEIRRQAEKDLLRVVTMP